MLCQGNGGFGNWSAKGTNTLTVLMMFRIAS